MASNSSEPPQIAVDSVLLKSEPMPDGSETVKGYDFNQGTDYHALLQSYKNTGFQAMHFGKAVDEINKMIAKKKEPYVPNTENPELDILPTGRPKNNCTIFLAYTSNMISCGVREVIRYLVQNNMVDVLVTTGGGIEEDFMKCLAPSYLGDFSISGEFLRKKGINRIGNLLVPNDNYCKLEDFIQPVLDKMLEEQQNEGINWTPSKFIARLGKEINHPESVYYWAYKNNIPVFSPAITDGAIGDAIYFHSYRNPGLKLDIAEDVRLVNNHAVFSKNTGIIILGGGLVKHHVCNANMMRNGADYAVYVNTAQEFDGSDSGARPDEAVSWGKIKATATPVKIYGESSLIFPLLVAETFARNFKSTPDKS
ncbi:predicted protein [Nematostella vectensis]|uniref:deoxyhypusine synthase n=1 Tax=Nematostella vectensis TaxID=45351 RepID=A7SNR4_NEMVE|nr:deoxyhypusine synthase [Nematostella vectensis]EDO34643.1 predicted protein [Nematostella vectensis]|eukprot:XP_001626743.1 predicted protein [Nematostella vectensis]